ncbi:MAG: ABC transporter ATP-binding protein [Betaproteobacteria bacterium]
MNANAPQLELAGVHQAYDGRPVVRGLTFAVARGAIGCLLGPSGCGKTTALRCIAGFEPLAAGTIRLAGVRVSAPGVTVAPERRRIGMVFQDYALFPHLTVARNVAFGLHHAYPGTRRHRVAQMLDAVGLADAGARFAHELSGGQQQRVALARALAPQPDLLLLDEPFSNLDVHLRERLSYEVRAIIKRTNTTAVLVTHDQNEALAMADEIGVMADGAIAQWDTAYNLYHRPASRFVADFVGQGVFLPGRVHADRRVEIELGLLTGTVAGDGTDVDVLLRPDDIVHDDASPQQAEVLAKAFRGAEILYTLRLDSGRRVLALVPSHHNHALGEWIGIRLDVDHVVAFAPLRDAAHSMIDASSASP